MKHLLLGLLALSLSLTACGTSGAECQGDRCVCTDSCDHVCGEGTPECNVQGAPGRSVDVTCDQNLECNVECSASSSCMVDCGGSLACHVTCPATGCTVTNCVGPGCVVACGFGAAATRTGSVATCP